MSVKCYRLSEIAEKIGATLQGDADTEISGIASIGHAQSGQITFLHHPKFRKFLPQTQASAVIVTKEAAEHCSVNTLIVSNPHLAYAKTAELFIETETIPSGIHSTAIIGKDCEISDSATIGPYCVLDDRVTVGENSVIGAHTTLGNDSHVGKNCYFAARVTLYHRVVVGDRVLLHSGVVLGADGFGMAQDNGVFHKIPHLGGVKIGSDVEIGANSAVDRGALDDTVIEDGVKIDNHVQVGHNVHIGAHTVIAGCTGIGGSTRIGRHCMLGGHVGVADHAEITDQVMIAGGSNFAGTISKPGAYGGGTPLQPLQRWKRSVIHYSHFDEIVKRLRKLEKKNNG